MTFRKQILIFYFLLLAFISCTNTKTNKNTSVFANIETKYGKIKIVLYNETSLHKKNFKSLVTTGFYNGLLLHKVRKDIMIETGDQNSKNANADAILGGGSYGKPLEPEFNDRFLLKKGAIIALRTSDEKNPQKKSSGSQFAIVLGRKYTDSQLDALEYKINISNKETSYKKYFAQHPEIDKKIQQLQTSEEFKKMDSVYAMIDKKLNIKNFKISPEHRKIYINTGGLPYIKQKYTVFGEVTEGFDVLDKISKVEVDENDRPVKDIRIKIELSEIK